ncbi:LysR family transcriptional regulator [Bradyrhizobium sp. Pear77]|uniref:LysR family transcriptional regulator n=1 Tax=Bradyrhizobium altum TaxID=1571202 RepID=UPI001E366749|nr:LysR family transcriptional regulator [Bradyrhizobium altum]MCC8957358.1 LysR family transcriptional regulator [Bradyrhizobium altum]
MHNSHKNNPIEILRSIVAISDTGSLSRAAKLLDLSQPAVSAHVKRLQNMVGGVLFARKANGTIPTELGKLAVLHARRVLDDDDQLLRLALDHEQRRPLRLGLSSLLADEFFRHHKASVFSGLFVHVEDSMAILRGLVEERIDVGCAYEDCALGEDITAMIVKEATETSVWVRSREFVLNPGAPIPLLTWRQDNWVVRALVKQGLPYRIVLESPDHHSRLAAVRACVGVTCVPKRIATPDLVRGSVCYLPELPGRRLLLCVRPGSIASRAKDAVDGVSSPFFRENN